MNYSLTTERTENTESFDEKALNALSGEIIDSDEGNLEWLNNSELKN